MRRMMQKMHFTGVKSQLTGAESDRSNKAKLATDPSFASPDKANELFHLWKFFTQRF